MAEEDETRFERLERSHQETREQISEMMEMIRALVREKGKAAAPNPRMRRFKQTKEKKSMYIQWGLLSHMLLISIWHKHHQRNKPEGSRMAMPLHRHW